MKRTEIIISLLAVTIVFGVIAFLPVIPYKANSACLDSIHHPGELCSSGTASLLQHLIYSTFGYMIVVRMTTTPVQGGY